MELMGLVLSNGVIALAGALIAQRRLCRCVSRDRGYRCGGLASFYCGEVIFKSLSLAERLVTIVVVYRLSIYLVWGYRALV